MLRNTLTYDQAVPFADRMPDPAVRSGKKGQDVPDHTDLSEPTQWMLRVRDGRDRAAFGALFDHFGPRLKGMAMRGGLTAAEAEDVVQDTMLKVWQKAALFDPGRAQVSGWIYQIARNQSIDLRRKERRPIPEELTRPQDSTPDATGALELEQEAQALRSALDKLPQAQRQMVEALYLGEQTQGDVQSATGLPLGTIKSRIRLALDKLRHELKGTRV